MTVDVAAPHLGCDAALPHRDVLLDPAAMRRVFAAFPRIDAPIAEPTVVRVNYQIGKSLRAVYRASIDGATHTVAARMFRNGKSADVYGRARRHAADVGWLRGVVHIEALSTVCWLFPNDRKIDTLRNALTVIGPVADGMTPVAATRPVAYAPEKSATLACDDESGRPIAYAKVAASYQAERDCRTYAALGSALPPTNRRLRLPAPLAYDHALRTLWIEAIDGRRLSESTDDDQAVEDLRLLGAALAVFHGLPCTGAPRFERFSADHLVAEAALFRAVRPDVADAADALARQLIATTPSCAPTVCLHGDLHPKNAIVTGDRLALIDVEDVAAGPAAADIGSFVASLLYLCEAGRCARASYEERTRAFLAGYDSVRLLPARSSLAWHTAAALLVERAARAVTRIRPLGLAHLGTLLNAARRVCDRGLEL